MNVGIIATRYARALYSLALDEGVEDIVYSEMKCMLLQFITYPELRKLMTSPLLKTGKKRETLYFAAGGDDITSVTKKFIDFVIKREKQEFIQFMCVAYKNVYREKKNILSSKFISATEVDETFLNKLKVQIAEAYGANIELSLKIDKNLIGGFILDVSNNQIDASVAGELNRMKIKLASGKG